MASVRLLCSNSACYRRFASIRPVLLINPISLPILTLDYGRRIPARRLSAFLVRNTQRAGRRFFASDVFRFCKTQIGGPRLPGPVHSRLLLPGELIAHHALGHFYVNDPAFALSYERQGIFDLASVTKVVATATMAMILYELRTILDLEAPVTAIVSRISAGDDSRRPRM